MEMVHGDMRPLLGLLGDYRNLNLNVIQRLTSLTQLFPHTFKEKLLEQLLVIFFKRLFLYILTNKKIYLLIYYLLLFFVFKDPLEKVHGSCHHKPKKWYSKK